MVVADGEAAPVAMGGSPLMGGGGIGNGDGAAVPKQETMATVELGSATGTMEDEE